MWQLARISGIVIRPNFINKTTPWLGGKSTLPSLCVAPLSSSAEKNQFLRARLLYQSRKRGILENGLLLGSFASKYLHGFDQTQLAEYDNLINNVSNDWEIYYWATGAKPTPAEFEGPVMDLLKEHTRNDDREARIRLPDL